MAFGSGRSTAGTGDRSSQGADDLATVVTDEIIWYMREQGITRAHLAETMHVSAGRVSQILSGAENVTLKTLDAVVTALGARLDVRIAPTEQTKPAPPAAHGSPPVADGAALRLPTHVQNEYQAGPRRL